MPTVIWTPKPGSPPSFWLSQQWAAYLATDNALLWLAQEVPLIGETFFVTSEFCAAGPYTAPPIGMGDLPGGRDVISMGLSALNWASKLHDVAMSQVFGALCEQLTPGGPSTCVDVHTNGGSPDSNGFITSPRIPVGCGPSMIVDFTSESDWWGDVYYYNPRTAYQVLIGSQHWTPGAHVQLVVDPSRIAVADDGIFIGPNGGMTDVRNHIVVTCTPSAGTPVYFTPESQPEPEGFIGPTRTIYDSFATLGNELDNQELKLDSIGALLRMQLATNVGQLVADGAAVPLASDAELAIPAGDVGLVVTVATLGAGVDESFGSPPRYYHLGRVVLGNALGWLSPLDLALSPMLVYPLPGGVDRVRVHVNGPSTVTVQLLAMGNGSA